MLIGFSIINHPFGDTPIFGNIHEMNNPCAEAGLCRELREKRLAHAERSRAGHRQKLLERWCGSSNEAVTS